MKQRDWAEERPSGAAEGFVGGGGGGRGLGVGVEAGALGEGVFKDREELLEEGVILLVGGGGEGFFDLVVAGDVEGVDGVHGGQVGIAVAPVGEPIGEEGDFFLAGEATEGVRVVGVVLFEQGEEGIDEVEVVLGGGIGEAEFGPHAGEPSREVSVSEMVDRMDSKLDGGLIVVMEER